MTLALILIGSAALLKSTRSQDWLSGFASICIIFIGYGVMVARVTKGVAL